MRLLGQYCMVYVNTLMFQPVLAQPHWTRKLVPRDLPALTPLIRERVNPYGRFELRHERPTTARLTQMAAGDTTVESTPTDSADESNIQADNRQM